MDAALEPVQLVQVGLGAGAAGLRAVLELLLSLRHLLLGLLQGLPDRADGVVRRIGRRLDDEEIDRRQGPDRDQQPNQPQRDVAEEVDARDLSAAWDAA